LIDAGNVILSRSRSPSNACSCVPRTSECREREFVEHDGQIGYDIILKETDPALVKLQIDLYWIAHGSKFSPNYWFKRAPGRFVMWHVKDLHKVSRDYTELGNGTIDFTKIWPDTELAGMKHFFVEQGGNFTHDPFRSITDSAEYVKRVLLR
jgi:sugar phosphate isomerase/epimerase